jgi:hypothetical protein
VALQVPGLLDLSSDSCAVRELTSSPSALVRSLWLFAYVAIPAPSAMPSFAISTVEPSIILGAAALRASPMRVRVGCDGTTIAAAPVRMSATESASSSCVDDIAADEILPKTIDRKGTEKVLI